MTYLESWEKSGLDTYAFYAKIFIWKFDLIWPDLVMTSVKSMGTMGEGQVGGHIPLVWNSEGMPPPEIVILAII